MACLSKTQIITVRTIFYLPRFYEQLLRAGKDSWRWKIWFFLLCVTFDSSSYVTNSKNLHSKISQWRKLQSDWLPSVMIRALNAELLHWVLGTNIRAVMLYCNLVVSDIEFSLATEAEISISKDFNGSIILWRVFKRIWFSSFVLTSDKEKFSLIQKMNGEWTTVFVV